MSLSSTSSTRNLQIFAANDDIEMCFCPIPLPAKERESWKLENPARRFMNCPNSLATVPHCKYWRWIDPPLNQHYKDTIWSLKGQIKELEKKEMKEGTWVDGGSSQNSILLLEQNFSTEVARLKIKLNKQKALRGTEKEKVNQLTDEVSSLEWKLQMHFMISIVIFVVMWWMMKAV